MLSDKKRACILLGLFGLTLLESGSLGRVPKTLHEVQFAKHEGFLERFAMDMRASALTGGFCAWRFLSAGAVFAASGMGAEGFSDLLRRR